jgi:hypothetical protein
LERKPQFFRAFSSELSVGRRVLLELCSNFRIVLLSSQALKGERVRQILFEQFQIGDSRTTSARLLNQHIREDRRCDGQRGEVERNDEGGRPHRGNIGATPATLLLSEGARRAGYARDTAAGCPS